MKIILLSGGSGKRLWPLSNDARSKQFLRLLSAPDGSKESMIQGGVRPNRAAPTRSRPSCWPALGWPTGAPTATNPSW